MSKRRRIYFKYLESAHWKSLRQQAWKRDDYKCTCCGSPNNLQGHHVKYRNPLERCTVDDIQTLCQKCHDALHRAKAKERKDNRKERRKRSMIDVILNFDAAA